MIKWKTLIIRPWSIDLISIYLGSLRWVSLTTFVMRLALCSTVPLATGVSSSMRKCLPMSWPVCLRPVLVISAMFSSPSTNPDFFFPTNTWLTANLTSSSWRLTTRLSPRTFLLSPSLISSTQPTTMRFLNGSPIIQAFNSRISPKWQVVFCHLFYFFTFIK